MIAHKQNIYFTRRLIKRLSFDFNNNKYLSEEQVPSIPMLELLNGKPKKASFTLGVKTLGTPLNNLNEEMILFKMGSVHKDEIGFFELYRAI